MRILILGASYDQIYMIRAAKSLGYEAWVADRDPGAPGMAEATKPVVVDTSDADALEQVTREARIDGICTMATNLAPRTVAEVARRVGLPAISPEAAFNSTDKARMRALCIKAGIPVADGGVARTLDEARRLMGEMRSRVILKPSDSSGCRGIFVVTNPASLPDLFARCMQESRSGEIVVERYHEESLVFGVESLIYEGKTHIILVADKIVRRTPRLTTAGVTAPSVLTPAQLEQLSVTIQRLHDVLGLHMGASHIDFIRDGEILKVIDVGPRLAGGPLIHQLAPQLTGVDMIRHVIEQSVGTARPPKRRQVASYGIERFLYAPCEGILEDYVLPEIGDQMTIQWRKERGSVLCLDGSNVDRMGVVTAIHPMIAEAEAMVRAYVDRIQVRICDGNGQRRELRPLVYSAVA